MKTILLIAVLGLCIKVAYLETKRETTKRSITYKESEVKGTYNASDFLDYKKTYLSNDPYFINVSEKVRFHAYVKAKTAK
jgi:hypothetical protein